MCGIAGLVWKDVARPADLAALRRMNHAQHHRGPDDGGEYADGPLALGHRRLSILDLSPAGHQPMASADGRLVLTYNGEIYNYAELREELAALGHRFRSGTDTEVLLAAYAQWGADCVARFNGMWAFAIHDHAQGRLFLSRDRFGIKPLHLAERPDVFAFASEMKALLAALPELRRANDAFLHHFLPSGALDDGPETAFAGITQLLPAHNAIYDIRAGRLSTWRWWEVQPEAFRDRWVSSDPVGELRGLLDSAIGLHMRSDVPVGTCLSGGLDSSTIVCLMAARRDAGAGPVRAYSGLYPDADCDEEPFVQEVLHHSGAAGASIRREPAGDLLRDMATITWHQDTPTAGPGLYTQFNVMRRAAKDVTVILDGQGGDELFAGYLPYYALRISDLADAGGLTARTAALRLSATVARHWGRQWLPGGGLGRAAPLAARLRGLLRRFAPATSAPAEPPFFHPALTERVGDRRIARTESAWPYPDRLSRTLQMHLETQSIPALLHYEDRNSMAFSLEARVPFLDYRIVEFALGLGAEWKIRDGWTKWVLRKAAEPALPASVTWRRSKLGYPTPFARWLRTGRDRDDMRDLLFSRSFLERGIATRESVAHYWERHQSGAADHGWLLWRYATTELWYRHFLDALSACPARPVPEHAA
jgi:asparagine synthase (glutamine-hydrolysing)